MKKLFTVTLTGLFIMGIFSFKSKSTIDSNKPILGMILLEDTNSMQIEKVLIELKVKWKLTIDYKESNKEVTILGIDECRIAIANMPFPIPGEDIQTTAEYNYLWRNGIEEAAKHRGHVILSITDAGKNPVKENILFSKIAAAIMNNSKALGIYMGERTLLLKKEFYMANTEMMTDEDFPLYNWIYFGFRQENSNNSIYTFGLADFNKPEMEIVNSDHSLEELNEMMFNLAHYVIASDVTLKDGETIGRSVNQKLEITYSKGKYLDGKTLKIKY